MKRIVLSILAALAVSACSTVETPTKYISRNDPGGSIIAREQFIEKVKSSGKPLEIHGYCVSACTLYLGMPEQICIDRDAVFGFHSAAHAYFIPDASGNLTRYATRTYPKPIYDWFWENIGAHQLRITNVSAHDLMAIMPNTYRHCS